MANQFSVNPLGGLNLGDSLGQAVDRYRQGELMDMQRQQFEQEQAAQAQAAEQQKTMRDLAMKAQNGDLMASQRLYAMNPTMGAQIDKAMGVRDEAQAQQVGGWLEKYLSTPSEQRGEFLQKTAGQTPFSVDDDLLEMDPAKRDQYASMLAGRYLNKEQIAMLQGNQPEPMTEYQQAQVDIDREKLDLRKLETEQRVLDRKLAQETNDLKRQELESKIEANKAKQEQAKRDTVAQQESSIARFDNALGTIEKIENSPGFSAAVGARIPFLDQLPGSDAQETIGLIDTLKSQSFLSEIQQMKGMGALSNAEGAKLESAISSLNVNMKEKAFKESLNTIRDYFKTAKNRAMKQMGKEPELSEADIMAKYGL